MGHAGLYASAYAVSILRSRVRVALTTRELHRYNECHVRSEAELRRVFERMDTSGDGYLDASELKVALCVCVCMHMYHA